MDMSKYLAIFKAESEKNIKEMSESLLALEQDPKNLEYMNVMFRLAHTFKGMAATMGFKQIIELTHEMESLIDRLRKKQLTLDLSLIDLLFECLGALEELVENACESLGNKVKEKEIDRDSREESHAAFKVLRALRNINTSIIETQAQSGEQKCKANSFSVSRQADEKEFPEIQKEVFFRKEGESAVEENKEIENFASSKLNSKVKDNQSSREQSLKIPSSRISTEQLDKLMNLVGELVITRSRVKELTGESKSKDLELALFDFQKLTNELQKEVLEVRMVPLDHITNIFPRMIRDLARTQNKKIDFTIKGKEIKLDRAILEEIGDPLVHLLRNSLDHGIETPEKRIELGKEETGSILITASRQENYVLIRIEDDGKGINTEEIRKAAIEKRIISREELEQLQDRDVMQLIFAPGLSTASRVTDISGRGIGLDIVKNRIERLGGSVKVESRPSSGSKFDLRLPLTIALYQAMLVKVGMERYAIPFTNITKNIEIEKEEVRYIKGEEVFITNGKVIPLLNLRRLFQLPVIQKEENLIIVIVEKAGQYTGLIVDKLLGKQEIIVKNFKSRLLERMQGFAGATILGDGSVILILDINSLV